MDDLVSAFRKCGSGRGEMGGHWPEDLGRVCES